MKIAKPSYADLDAASKLLQILNTLDRGAPVIPFDSVQDFFDLTDETDFDASNFDHLASLYFALQNLLELRPSFHNRVIGGMCYCIMWEPNQIIDPNSPTLALHPRFESMALELEAERRAARYWNKRYHQAVSAHDHLLDSLKS